MDVDDFGPEDVADLHDLGAGLGIGLDPDEHEFTVHIVLLTEVLDADHVHQLVELLVDLIEHLVVPPYHNCHP